MAFRTVLKTTSTGTALPPFSRPSRCGTVLAIRLGVIVTVADIIRRRDVLTPREAATLTLAIGLEWDRYREMDRDVALPDTAAIALDETGEISFLQLAPAAVAGSNAAAHLSSLLGGLLGIDQDERPSQPIPGGLLMSIAGRVGSVELPSANDVGFRAALVRFADPDPARVLRRLYWRAAAGRRRTDRRGALTLAASRRSPDRRRQPQAVTELRRVIRQLEKRAFEADHARVASAAPAPAHAARRERPWPRRMLAACAALLIAAAAFTMGARTAAPPSTVASATPVAHDVRLESTPPAIQASPVVSRSAPALSRAATSTAARPTTKRAVHVTRRPHPAAFAGGTRSISWMQTAR
jgi:hypothetical protein